MRSKLNLTKLTENELETISGGLGRGMRVCSCACRYSDKGGSSTNGNGNANFDGGKHSR